MLNQVQHDKTNESQKSSHLQMKRGGFRQKAEDGEFEKVNREFEK
jgi:hypothetical protein